MNISPNYMKVYRTLGNDERPDPATDIHVNNPDCWLRLAFEADGACGMFEQYKKYFKGIVEKEREKLGLDTQALKALQALKDYFQRP